MWNIDLKSNQAVFASTTFMEWKAKLMTFNPSTLLGPEGSVARNTLADRRGGSSRSQNVEPARMLRTSQWTRASL